MSLPGDVLKLPKGATCDCGKAAIVNIQGETDSFGYEENFMCQGCYDKYKTQVKEKKEQTCDWCKYIAICNPIRDYDEGMHGPVYYVCVPCKDRHNAKMMEDYELEFGGFDDD
jgi:hypothetical protein